MANKPGPPPVVFPPAAGSKKKKQTPAQEAAHSAAVAKAKAANPYYQGQLFQSKWHDQIDPIWEAYTGRPATKAQAQRVIALGWSNYHLQTFLSGQKAFVGSPVWKTNVPGYNSAWSAIMGHVGGKAPKDLIRYAIIHNIGAGGFEQLIRQSKFYLNSAEFKNNVASMQNVYQSIYGTATDPQAMHAIKSATLAGWSADQFAKYLRTQPEYQHSDEFQNNMNALAANFGLAPTMTGSQALYQPQNFTGVPVDSRLGPYQQPQQQQQQAAAKPAPPGPPGKLAPTPRRQP